MSDGKCGKHCYSNIDKTKIDEILDALKKNGCTVTGDNPWDVDTHKYGIKLRGTWDEKTSTLCIIVTDKKWYVPCTKIWNFIDPLIHNIQAPLTVAADGKCGQHCYSNIDRAKIDEILDALKKNGCTITGNNPWDVDTHKYGIKLRGTWDEKTSTLCIIVTDKDWYVPCSKIWDYIDPLIHNIQAPLTVAADGKCGKHCYPQIDKVKIDKILEALKENGCTVTGSNPWNVDTHKHGIKLQGTWDEKTSTLCIIVTDKDWYVPCSKIWDYIDPLIHNVQSLSVKEMK